MSRRQPRSSNTVSLFPFLAVLVCAMGALILLLLVTTRRIRSEALARAQDRHDTFVPVGHSHAGPIEGLREKIAAAQTKDPDVGLRTVIRQLQQQRDEGENRRGREEEQLATARQALEQAASELAELRRRVEVVHAEQAEDDLLQQTLTDRLASLTRDRASAKQRFDDIQQDNAAAQSKYVVVPFDGGRGTARRPILIECSDKGLRFLPEDVLLTMDDLVEFTASDNPLLSGTRALADHWTDAEREHRREGAAGQPYVLLIVRPSGVLAYDVARFLLQRMHQPFGYELLLEDWELDLPQRDPQAVAALRSAIERTVARQEPALPAGRSPSLRGRLGGQRHGFYEENLEDVLQRTYNDPLVTGKTGEDRPRYATTPSTRNTTQQHTIQQRTAARSPHHGATTSSRSEHSGAGVHGAAGEPPSLTEGVPKSNSGEGEAPAEPPMGSKTAAQQELPPPRPIGGESAAQQELRPPKSDSFGTHRDTLSDTAESQIRRPSSPEDLAPSRPDVQSFRNRWNPSGRRSGIGFERDVVVRVDADQLVVGRRQRIHLGRGETREDLVQDVLRAISSETQAWGPPPDKFYWIPTVRFIVGPGGNQHYERLRYPLEKFGLSTRADFVLEASSAADDLRR